MSPLVIKVAVLAAAAALCAPAPLAIELPAPFDSLQVELTARCGSERAHEIAAMSYAEHLHDFWAQYVVAHPELAAIAGGVDWHTEWSAEYARTVALLEQDCTPVGIEAAR